MAVGTGWSRMRRAGIVTTIALGSLLVLPGVALGATINGGSGRDTLIGTANADTISGRRGNDRLYGRGDGDTLYGNRGADRVFGEAGDDVLYGGRGNDMLLGGGGEDTFYGGPGNDLIRAAGDLNVDTIDCGLGNDDVAIVDASDIVDSDCEDVTVAGPDDPPAKP